eukprot:2870917-Alexandrium_andersonii.AAC.1
MELAHSLGPPFLPGSNPLRSDGELGAALLWTLVGRREHPMGDIPWAELGLGQLQRQTRLLLQAGGV